MIFPRSNRPSPVSTLSISDTLLPFIYSPHLRTNFDSVKLVLSCGDLPYYYLEYIISVLDIPLFFVRGNHDNPVEHTTSGPVRGPRGGVDLHGVVTRHNGLLLGGVEGCLRYSRGSYQYTQAEMWSHVLSLVPRLWYNRLRFGRFLDVFVSHAPPWGIHDQPDPTHQGVKAFRWLLRAFKPAYHFHGHIHVYLPETITETRVGLTQVINTYGYRETDLVIPGRPPDR